MDESRTISRPEPPVPIPLGYGVPQASAALKWWIWMIASTALIWLPTAALRLFFEVEEPWPGGDPEGPFLFVALPILLLALCVVHATYFIHTAPLRKALRSAIVLGLFVLVTQSLIGVMRDYLVDVAWHNAL